MVTGPPPLPADVLSVNPGGRLIVIELKFELPLGTSFLIVSVYCCVAPAAVTPGNAAMLNCFVGPANPVAAKVARTAARSHLAIRYVALINVPRYSDAGMMPARCCSRHPSGFRAQGQDAYARP